MKIERVEQPSYGDFRRHFLDRNVPVVITGAIEGWPARRKWTFDYVAGVIGERRIKPVIMSNGNFHLDVNAGVRVSEMSFPEYVRNVAAERTHGAPPYYLRLPLEGEYEGLFEKDFEIPIYCQKRIFMKSNLWVGAPGASSDLHYDMTHNIVSQVMGRRRVLVFEPEQTPLLYPFPHRTLNWHHSQVHVEDPDFARFPRYREARPTEIEFSAGDSLFIPQGWWHRFETVEDAIALNFFWLTLRLAPAMAISRALWVANGIRT